MTGNSCSGSDGQFPVTGKRCSQKKGRFPVTGKRYAGREGFVQMISGLEIQSKGQLSDLGKWRTEPDTRFPMSGQRYAGKKPGNRLIRKWLAESAARQPARTERQRFPRNHLPKASVRYGSLFNDYPGAAVAYLVSCQK